MPFFSDQFFFALTCVEALGFAVIVTAATPAPTDPMAPTSAAHQHGGYHGTCAGPAAACSIHG